MKNSCANGTVEAANIQSLRKEFEVGINNAKWNSLLVLPIPPTEKLYYAAQDYNICIVLEYL